jgi:hypothetical protein
MSHYHNSSYLSNTTNAIMLMVVAFSDKIDKNIKVLINALKKSLKDLKLWTAWSLKLLQNKLENEIKKLPSCEFIKA